MKIRDLVMSVAAIGVLVALIALADDRVRERIDGVSPRAVSHRVVDGTTQLQAATTSARDLAMDNGPLTLLVIAGAVLLVSMLRT